MSNKQEYFDNDSDWYRAKCAELNLYPNPDMEESFLERVGIKCANGIAENEARQQAFEGKL